MRVWIERPIGRLTVDVAILDEHGRTGSAAVGIDDEGHLVWRELERRGSLVPVFLRLDPAVLEAIVRAAADVVPASDATTRHLDDAIGVRDKLLRLVTSLAADAIGIPEAEVRE